MNTDAVLKAADHAAAMSDRWMFVATLLVFGLCAVAVARYFVHQHERLIADHKEARDTYQSSLRGMVVEQSAANAKLMVCLDNNSRVLEECRLAFSGSHADRRESKVDAWMTNFILALRVLE